MSAGGSRGGAVHAFRDGLVAECWASDLVDGCRIKGRYATTEPTKNIITHQDFRHASGTGPHIDRNWNGTGRDRLRFGPGQQLVLVPANAPGAANDHGKTLKLGFKGVATDGLAKALSLGQSTPGFVAVTMPAGTFAGIGATANVSAQWTFNSTIITVIKDAGNAKDWYALAGGPYVFRCKADFGATPGFDVSFTATATDNLIAEIAAQLVTLLNAALNTLNGTTGVAYAAYASGTNAITITNSAIGANPALGLGKYSLTLTVKDAGGTELTDQFHETQQASASTTAALIWRMPPDFDIDADFPQLYRTADLVAGALPDPSTENRQGHWFANYGFTGAAATGGAGKYLDNDGGVARGYLAVPGTHQKMTIQVLAAQMERTSATKWWYAGITDDETSTTSSSFGMSSYLNSELAFQPDQSSANESGLIDFSGKGVQILTHVVDTEGRVRRELFLNEMSVLFDHSSAPWAGVTFKSGLWMSGSTGSLIYDPTTGLKTRIYAVRFWNRALTYRETWQSIAEWRGEALVRGISLGAIRYVVILADSDSLTAWRSGAYDSWIYQLFRDPDFNGELIVVNCANGGSGYEWLDTVGGYESPNGTSEGFENFERIRVLPAIRAAKQMGAFVITIRSDGTNNKNQIKAAGVAAYNSERADPSRVAIRAAGSDIILENETIARGGDAAFDPIRQALNASRFDRIGTLIDDVADITGTPMDDYAEATAAMTTGSLYFGADGIHGKPAGQAYRAAAMKPLILNAIPATYGLREDGGFELREDGGLEVRE